MLLFAIACLASRSVAAAGAQQSTPADGTALSEIVTFSGPIDAASDATFIAAQADHRVARVVLASPGGDVEAGIVLGEWILDRCVDVEVRKACASSCANDPFIVGRRKIIDEGAIVIWHGSALQKDFRRRLGDCVRRLDDLAHAGGELRPSAATSRH